MIRKTLSLLALTLCLAIPASAQGIPGLSNVGVKGGASFANLRGDLADDADLGYATGFTGGIYGQLEVVPFFSPRLEVLYTQQGASIDGFGDDASIDLDYIQVPLLAKVNVPIVNRVFPSLYVGPYASFAVNRQIDLGDDADEIDADDAFNSTDYGLVFGTDVDFSFAGKSLTLSGRYNLGLNDLVDDDSGLAGVGFVPDDNLRTSTFMVTLGVGL